MALDICGTTIERVVIIDDDQSVRASYEYPVEDLDLRPVQEVGPIRDLNQFVRELMSRAEAAICDHHLRVSNYAAFNGAELVASLYKSRFPAVLCTRWERARLEDIRQFRRYIPALLKPDELNPESLTKGLSVCIEEFKDNFSPSRRPWRTLVRIVDVDKDRGLVDIVVPGWDPKEVVRINLDALPLDIQGNAVPGFRLHARVNIGAESQEELFFDAWE